MAGGCDCDRCEKTFGWVWLRWYCSPRSYWCKVFCERVDWSPIVAAGMKAFTSSLLSNEVKS